MWRDTEHRYGLATRALHWGVAILIPALIWLGWHMADLGRLDPRYGDVLTWHEALGIVAFALGAVATSWVTYSRPPGHPAERKRRGWIAALTVRELVHTMMLLIPLTGVLFSLSDGGGVDLWGLYTIPADMDLSEDRRDLLVGIHLWCAYAVGILALVHVTAVIKRRFVDRDDTLRSML